MATPLDSAKRLQIELALRELNANFCYFLDHHETDQLVDLFTDDAIYTHGERRSQGRDAIFRLFHDRETSGPRTARHMQSGLRFRITDEHTAAGQSICMTFVANQLPPIMPAIPHLVADFVDEYRHCSDKRWRICRRHIERIFVDVQNEGPIGIDR